MKSLFPMAVLVLSGFFPAPTPCRADEARLSPERLDLLNDRGYFTPAFKATVRDLVNTKQMTSQAMSDAKKLKEELPDLQKQAADADAKLTLVRQELEKYNHTDNSDFSALQERMKDPAAKPEDLMTQAQAYAWAYPTSPRSVQAQEIVQQIQKKLADQAQAEKDAVAAAAAAHAKLLQRVAAHDLSLNDWRDFLRDMSEEDVLKYLGRPDHQGLDYWAYSGAWTVDTSTGQKVGLQVTFNGTRVNTVALGDVAP